MARSSKLSLFLTSSLLAVCTAFAEPPEGIAPVSTNDKPELVFKTDLELWKNRRPTDSTPIAPPPIKEKKE